MVYLNLQDLFIYYYIYHNPDVYFLEEYDKSSQRSEVKDEEVGHQPEKFAHTLKLSPSEVVFTSCYSSNANAKHVFVLFLQDVNFIILALFHLFGPVYSS